MHNLLMLRKDLSPYFYQVSFKICTKNRYNILNKIKIKVLKPGPLFI